MTRPAGSEYTTPSGDDTTSDRNGSSPGAGGRVRSAFAVTSSIAPMKTRASPASLGQRQDPDLHVPDRSVRPHDAVLDRDVVRVAEDLGPGLVDVLTVHRMDGAQPVVAEGLLARQPGDLEEPPVDPDDPVTVDAAEHADRRGEREDVEVRDRLEQIER